MPKDKQVDDQETELDDELSPEELEDDSTDDDELEESDDPSDEEEADDDQEDESGEEESDDDDSETEDEITITIDGEAPPQEEDEKAPKWVKELRKTNREKDRENRALKAELEALKKGNAPAKKEVGPKPKLEDYDYDTEKFETELASWYERKREADVAAREAEAAQERDNQHWQAKLNRYNEKKQALKSKMSDYDEVEATVLDQLNQVQQGIIVQGADDPALVICALGKNPKRLEELAKINDPVEFTFAVAKLETKMKVSNRKAPPPEKRVNSGTAPKSGTVDSTLERLRAEAEKTGNYSKVVAYKRKKRKAG